MNAAAVLALIGDLYGQVSSLAKQLEELAAERDALRAELDRRSQPPARPAT